MKKICFLTGNINKYNEAKEIISDLEMLELDLFEIQEIDAKHVIEEKLKIAMTKGYKNIIVDDTSLSFDSMNGFPGPLIKWLGMSVGIEAIPEMLRKLGNTKAEAITFIGYADEEGNISYFEGRLRGEIVSFRGENGFGWDPIFLPENSNKTLAEMTLEEKNEISTRRTALNKFKEFLNNNL